MIVLSSLSEFPVDDQLKNKYFGEAAIKLWHGIKVVLYFQRLLTVWEVYWWMCRD